MKRENDIIGIALLDYLNHTHDKNIVVISDLTLEDELPLSYLFRNYEQMPKIEQFALQNCKGKVLDVGCGSGIHSLYLQQNGFDVTALDISKGACEVAQKIGVKNINCTSIENFNSDQKFDTILLLMNGIGLAKTLKNLSFFINKLCDFLNKDGQIIFESTDISYMYQEEDGNYRFDISKNYMGELIFKMKYKNYISEKFNWLYVESELIKSICAYLNLSYSNIYKGESNEYLGKIKK